MLESSNVPTDPLDEESQKNLHLENKEKVYREACEDNIDWRITVVRAVRDLIDSEFPDSEIAKRAFADAKNAYNPTYSENSPVDFLNLFCEKLDFLILLNGTLHATSKVEAFQTGAQKTAWQEKDQQISTQFLEVQETLKPRIEHLREDLKDFAFGLFGDNPRFLKNMKSDEKMREVFDLLCEMMQTQSFFKPNFQEVSSVEDSFINRIKNLPVSIKTISSMVMGGGIYLITKPIIDDFKVHVSQFSAQETQTGIEFDASTIIFAGTLSAITILQTFLASTSVQKAGNVTAALKSFIRVANNLSFQNPESSKVLLDLVREMKRVLSDKEGLRTITSVPYLEEIIKSSELLGEPDITDAASQLSDAIESINAGIAVSGFDKLLNKNFGNIATLFMALSLFLFPNNPAIALSGTSIISALQKGAISTSNPRSGEQLDLSALEELDEAIPAIQLYMRLLEKCVQGKVGKTLQTRQAVFSLISENPNENLDRFCWRLIRSFENNEFNGFEGMDTRGLMEALPEAKKEEPQEQKYSVDPSSDEFPDLKGLEFEEQEQIYLFLSDDQEIRIRKSEFSDGTENKYVFSIKWRNGDDRIRQEYEISEAMYNTLESQRFNFQDASAANKFVLKMQGDYKSANAPTPEIDVLRQIRRRSIKKRRYFIKGAGEGVEIVLDQYVDEGPMVVEVKHSENSIREKPRFCKDELGPEWGNREIIKNGFPETGAD